MAVLNVNFRVIISLQMVCMPLYSMNVQCILTYPNLDYPNPRISEQPKAGL